MFYRGQNSGDNENEIPIVYVKIPKGEISENINFEFQLYSTRYVTEKNPFLENIINLVDYKIPKILLKMEKCGEKIKKGIHNLDIEILKQLTIK